MVVCVCVDEWVSDVSKWKQNATPPTFRCRVFHVDWHVDQPLNDHDDRHFRKYPLRPDADAYAMSVHHAMHGYAHGCDANDGQMNVLNEANVADALDVDFVSDADIDRKQNDFRPPIAAYI